MRLFLRLPLPSESQKNKKGEKKTEKKVWKYEKAPQKRSTKLPDGLDTDLIHLFILPSFILDVYFLTLV
jgi:hypothetical protein